MKEYFALANDALAAASELSKGQIPAITIPEPNTDESPDGLLAFYPIPPELGVDGQFLPSAGLSKNVLALSLSRSHTERLLRSIPLKYEHGPLADVKNKKLASAMAFNWPALVDAIAPWAEFGVSMAKLPPPGPEGEIMPQLKTVFEILKCFRGVTSATYYEDGMRVTHAEIFVEDLK
jgi:hypothetical protein